MAIENVSKKIIPIKKKEKNIPVKVGINVNSMQIAFISKLYFWMFPQKPMI